MTNSIRIIRKLQDILRWFFCEFTLTALASMVIVAVFVVLVSLILLIIWVLEPDILAS